MEAISALAAAKFGASQRQKYTEIRQAARQTAKDARMLVGCAYSASSSFTFFTGLFFLLGLPSSPLFVRFFGVVLVDFGVLGVAAVD